MLLQDRVLNTIKKHSLISSGDRIVIAVSGGPDSICLLHLLHRLKDSLKIQLFAFHLNHMLREEESDKDEEYVIHFCQGLQVPLMNKAVDVKEYCKNTGLSIEEGARELRYQELNTCCQLVKGTKIAVAHNKNDQAETILMRMIRGTGLDGLTGMEYQNGRIIRPLLEADKQEILEYCNINSLKPRQDSSNLQNIYTRNKIRLDLIPQIDRWFKTDISESLFRMSKILKEDKDFIEKQGWESFQDAILQKEGEQLTLHLEKLKKAPPALLNRILRFAIQEIKGNLKGIERVHLELVQELIFFGQTGSSLCLPQEVRIEKSYEMLQVKLEKREETGQVFHEAVQIPGTTIISGTEAILEATLSEIAQGETWNKKTNSDSNLQYFDYDKLGMGIKIRNRSSGDVIRPLNSNGTKKLKEYLIDVKVPRKERDLIPVLAKENEVVWLVGYKISDKFKVTENTKSIVKLEYKKK